ncbi:T9SS type A sorting domain-containing protein [Abyssalbus ytuae]|uniref:T9SS type A sorting domain-containing protein n=1 Tax=Abyssalbus ytuae TaxID=2926907 RepID=A0A9E7CY76_9FLAO|nr:T9SS type A sorting domain-containing protein [Abyssalbus ytuae]UOB16345.1 T9SS type A sorting domain-containing protein [Abyssalbus ytuae]
MNKFYLIFFLLVPFISVAQSSADGLSQDRKEQQVVDSPSSVVIEEDFKLIPNPVTDGYVTLKLANSRFFKYASVYDVLGKEVLIIKNVNSPVDISSLKAGVYIIAVTEIGKTSTRKLVIK